MKQLLILLAVLITIALIIAACSASGTFGTPEPGPDNNAAAQKARADSAMQQAQQQEADANAAAANETAQAQSAAANETEQAQAADFPSTQSAMFAQQTAQAIEAKATLDARAMLLVQQQAQTTATAQALQRDNVTAEQVASASQRQRELMSWLIPIVAAAVFGLVLLLGAKLISGMIDAANQRRSLENQRLALLGTLFEAPTETIIFADDPQTGFVMPLPLHMPVDGKAYDTPGFVASHAPIIDTEAPPVIVLLSYGDKMLADRAEAREEAARCKLAMKLLRDAINHMGAQSNRIPPAARLSWPAGAWTIAVTILRPYGVETLLGTDGGTYLVGQYPTLQALYIAIGERRLILYPPLAESITNG
jgi:hypothetical protein